MTNLELGIYLKTHREGLGYSTYDINKLCDISPSYISLVENGKRKPSPVILKKLSSIYNLDYIDLLEKAGFIDLAEKEKIQNETSSFRYASYNGIDLEGLDENDIKEITRFVEFVKNKKKNKSEN